MIFSFVLMVVFLFKQQWLVVLAVDGTLHMGAFSLGVERFGQNAIVVVILAFVMNIFVLFPYGQLYFLQQQDDPFVLLNICFIEIGVKVFIWLQIFCLHSQQDWEAARNAAQAKLAEWMSVVVVWVVQYLWLIPVLIFIFSDKVFWDSV